MARPKKQTVDYFPEWKPLRLTLIKFQSMDFKIRYMAIRNSSSAFIKRHDVREIIFKRDNYKCVLCGSILDLQVDHTVSVYQVAKNKYPIEKLNVKSNLMTLCYKCNAGKAP